MIDKVYHPTEGLLFETDQAGEAFRWARAECASSGHEELIVTLDGDAHGYTIGFLYGDDVQSKLEAIR